jgi:hypothetical protein
MLDVMYDLPDLDRKGRHTVTADVVLKKVPLQMRKPEPVEPPRVLPKPEKISA